LVLIDHRLSTYQLFVFFYIGVKEFLSPDELVLKNYPFLKKYTNKKLPGKDDIPILVNPDVMAFIIVSKRIEDLEAKLQKLKLALIYNLDKNYAYISKTREWASICIKRGIEAVENVLKMFTTFKLSFASQFNKFIMADLYQLQKSLGKEKLYLVEKDHGVLVVCFKDNADELKKKFENQIKETQKSKSKTSYQTDEIEIEEVEFLDRNSLSTEVFLFQDDGARRYLLEQRKEVLNSIESDLAQYSVQVINILMILTMVHMRFIKRQCYNKCCFGLNVLLPL